MAGAVVTVVREVVAASEWTPALWEATEAMETEAGVAATARMGGREDAAASSVSPVTTMSCWVDRFALTAAEEAREVTEDSGEAEEEAPTREEPGEAEEQPVWVGAVATPVCPAKRVEGLREVEEESSR